MSSTLVSNGSGAVWIHNAVGELWLAALNTKIRALASPPPELSTLSQEIERALSAGWVEGALQYDFASLLQSGVASDVFRSLQVEVESNIKASASTSSIITQGSYQAAAEFALPEVQMLSRLFFDKDSVPSPPHIYLRDRGWTLA
jgi:hypothetical protein